MVYQLYPALLLLFVLSKPWHGVYGLDFKTASAFASSSLEYFVNICSLLTPNSSIEMIACWLLCSMPASFPSSAHSALSS